MIYLCFPNNPTGTVLTKEELKKWVDYAKANNSVILYDAAYEAFITEEKYHIVFMKQKEQRKLQLSSKLLKTAGFTGVRCAYVVIPKELKDIQRWKRNKL